MALMQLELPGASLVTNEKLAIHAGRRIIHHTTLGSKSMLKLQNV